MAAGVPARLTAAEGRRFGLTVGCAFLALAAMAWWRAHPATMFVIGSLGTALALAGLAIPTRLGPISRMWMRLARLVSKVTTPVLMSVVYLLVVTPVGVARRALGGNPLLHRPREGSYWKTRPEGRRAGNLTRQF